MSKISFKTKVSRVDTWNIVRLPDSASEQLPSRGLVMVEGTINGHNFQAPLEPDGMGGHWLNIDQDLADAVPDESVELKIKPSEEWPEPLVPEDLEKALKADPEARKVWIDTTTLARWDWIRSIRSTKNPETRKKRIKVACSKLKSGKRRPCCFDRSQCTVPEISKSGRLLES